MNNRYFKYSIFLAIGIGVYINFLLEFENNNKFLLAHEQEKSMNYINNKNLQYSSTINSHTNNVKKLISIDDVNEIRTISNNSNDYTYEMNIHIPKGSFYPATHRSFNPDEVIINKG